MNAPRGGKAVRLARAVVPILLLAVASCDRRPRFVQQGADSSVTPLSPDSSAALAQAAQDMWDRVQDSRSVSQASAASIRLARDYLSARGGSMAAGLDAYLDSLGFGAEIAADPRDDNLVAVNFFSRANPAAGSAPYLIWREASSVRSQGMEGRGLRLLQAVTRVVPAREAAVLFGRPVAGGLQPLLLVLRRTPSGSRWELVQSVGADSLGGIGKAELAWADSTPVVRARTYTPAPHFEECGSCPHIYHQRVLEWGPEGFHSISDMVENTSYRSFVQFVGQVEQGDDRGASDVATDMDVVGLARHLGWDRPGPSWRVAPGAAASNASMVFYRGAKDAYRVSFQFDRGRWLVAAIDTTYRAIE